MSATRQPPALDTRSIEMLLASRPTDVAKQVRRTLDDIRPCVQATSVRVGERPLKAGVIARLLGGQPSLPQLSVVASKFGGVPYSERGREPGNVLFLGQINFAEVSAELDAGRFPKPAHMPAKGILALDLADGMSNACVRWYPEPDVVSHVNPGPVPSSGKYEAAIAFAGGWSLKGLDWYTAVPQGDGELWEALIDFDRGEVDGHHHDRHHKLFGHTDEILNEFFDVERARRGSRPEDYVQVWRITFDNEAGFSWGTNWLYVLLHRDHLATGDFAKAIVMVANA